jgi:hypothetical protein
MIKNKEFEYTVVETKMSAVKFSKCLNQTSLICIFKAFGVILLHFKVDKFNQGVILHFWGGKKLLSRWRPQWVGRVTGTTPIFFIWPKLMAKNTSLLAKNTAFEHKSHFDTRKYAKRQNAG